MLGELRRCTGTCIEIGFRTPQPVKLTSSLQSPGLSNTGGQRFHRILEPLHRPTSMAVPSLLLVVMVQVCVTLSASPKVLKTEQK